MPEPHYIAEDLDDDPDWLALADGILEPELYARLATERLLDLIDESVPGRTSGPLGALEPADG